MRLYIDAGNTRLKWSLEDESGPVASGVGVLDEENPLPGLAGFAGDITGIAVSTVASEEKRRRLLEYLAALADVPARFYWAEAERGGLRNAYIDFARMGADRWHAMYGAWVDHRRGFAIVDAGSAVTVDYVDPAGNHL
ncbi:MAG: type III pantothenate kinase, partial [Marinobacter sp.]|nr:type III pantothenate kinase [Marinobacter sp.]